MSYSAHRRALSIGVILAVLSPAMVLGLQRTKAYASSPDAATVISGSALASSQYGPVSVIVSGGNGGTVSLSLSIGKFFYSFTLPARDFTQNTKSATLDTHGDLKGYGVIRLTWAKHTIHVPATKGSACGGKPIPAHDVTTLINGQGSATLHLPCLSALGLHFGGSVKFPPSGYPSAGVTQGITGTFSFILPNSSNLSITVRKGLSASQKVDLTGSSSHSYAGTASAAPLQSLSQSFHTRVPASRVTFQSDLSGGSLSFSSGPKMLRGTSINLSALGNPIPITGTKGTACSPGTRGGGANRSQKLQGQVSVHLCAISGTFQADSSHAFGSLYSSTLVVQPPKPLKVVKIVPADKATGVATSLPAIVVTFSNQMSALNASATLIGGIDFQSLTKPTLDASKKVMTFALTKALQANTSYKLTLFAFDNSQQTVSSNTTFTTGT